MSVATAGAKMARRSSPPSTLDAPDVTAITPGGTAITTIAMCTLAARLGDGRASRDDLQLAERLIMALVDRLPADSAIDIRNCDSRR